MTMPPMIPSHHPDVPVMMIEMGLLGALITFAPAPLYAPHLGTTHEWGLSPFEDQQLTGMLSNFTQVPFQNRRRVTRDKCQPKMFAIRSVSAYSLTSTTLPRRRVKSMWYWFS